MKKSKKHQVVKDFKALSNNARLEILLLLREKRLCVNALANRLDVSQPAVSQHLKVLENAGLVKGNKIGNRVHYSLVPNSFEESFSTLKKLMRGGEIICATKKINAKIQRNARLSR